MGYYFVLAPCAACGRRFGFHPDRVPSLRVNGVREPVCQECVKRANAVRQVKGLPLIVPLPGAYEPVQEEGSESFLEESGGERPLP